MSEHRFAGARQIGLTFARIVALLIAPVFRGLARVFAFSSSKSLDVSERLEKFAWEDLQ